MRLSAFVVVAALLLAGCGSGFERKAAEPRVYRLTPPSLAGGPGLAADLVVLRPVVAQGLRTERIASLWPGNRLDYFAGAVWAGELGAVVQGAAVEALASGGRLRSVEGEPARFGASHALALEVRRFEADYVAGSPPVARVTLVATLGRAAERRALANWTASADVAATSNTLAGVTAALDAAFGQSLAALLAQAQAALAADAG